MKCFQVTVRQPSHRPQCCVESTGGVPFGKYEVIELRQDVVVDGQENIEAGKVSADMSDAALKVHLQQSHSARCCSPRCA